MFREAVRVGGNIKVIVFGVKGNQVRIGIDAPKQVEIHRSEIYGRIIDVNVVKGFVGCDQNVGYEPQYACELNEAPKIKAQVVIKKRRRYVGSELVPVESKEA